MNSSNGWLLICWPRTCAHPSRYSGNPAHISIRFYKDEKSELIVWVTIKKTVKKCHNAISKTETNIWKEVYYAFRKTYIISSFFPFFNKTSSFDKRHKYLLWQLSISVLWRQKFFRLLIHHLLFCLCFLFMIIFFIIVITISSSSHSLS